MDNSKDLMDSKGLMQFAMDSLHESSKSLHNSSLSIRRTYLILLIMYCLLFVVGLGTAICAIVKGFLATNPGQAIPALVFAGLSATSFFMLFITNPLESLERNAIYSSWLIAAVNTYWAELMCILPEAENRPEMLKHATAEFVDLLRKLAGIQEEALAKRPALTPSGIDGAKPTANEGSPMGASQSPTPMGHGDSPLSPITGGNSATGNDKHS